MEKRIYRVKRIDGEYAYLSDERTGEELFIALALLPPSADIDVLFVYEDLAFSEYEE